MTNLLINEITFSSQDVAKLYGFAEQDGKFRPIIFACSKQELFMMLMTNGKEGLEVMNAIRKAQSIPHASPLSFDLIDRFGLTTELKWEFNEGRISNY